MKYNFDEIIDRSRTDSVNVEGFRPYMFSENPDVKFSTPDDAFIRMWVADMDFAVAPEILQAIKDRVDRRILGYTGIYGDEYYDAFSAWCKDRYDWSFPKEQLVFSPGIIPALYELVGDLVKENEKYLIVTPAYGFFRHAGNYNKREALCSPLKYEEGDFSIDFEDFEKKAADPAVKLVLWCSPHNPTGRVWTWEEAARVAEIVEKYDLWIISDEIHCDLLREGIQHVPMGKIMPEYDKLITCMAASKTFNMAGLMFSNIIIRDRELRDTFVRNDKIIGAINPLSLAANEAAYRYGWPWLCELKSYIDENMELVREYLAENLPEAVFRIPEATYFAWVDFNAYLKDVEDLSMFFASEAGVLLEGGDKLFVGNAEGFVRLNLAMPHQVVRKGLEQIAEAVKRHGQRE